MTKCVSVLVPLMFIDEHLDVVLNKLTKEEEVAKVLNLPSNCFTVYPLTSQGTLAVHLNDLRKSTLIEGVTFLQLEEIVKENGKLVQRYQRLKEMIRPQEQRPSISLDNDLEGLMRKAKKLKEVKEENKKLRKLLQVQLDNTEKIREQTQKTMNNLKDQFDALVREMHNKSAGRATDYSGRYAQPLS